MRLAVFGFPAWSLRAFLPSLHAYENPMFILQIKLPRRGSGVIKISLSGNKDHPPPPLRPLVLTLFEL
jgi:hypothetical protein